MGRAGSVRFRGQWVPQRGLGAKKGPALRQPHSKQDAGRGFVSESPAPRAPLSKGPIGQQCKGGGRGREFLRL